MGPTDFNPLKARNTFRIATTDYFEQVALPRILKILEKEAPDITIICRPTLGSLPKASKKRTGTAIPSWRIKFFVTGMDLNDHQLFINLP